MNIVPFDLAAAFSLLGGMLVLAACVLLWLRDRNSPWVLLALAGQAVSVLCRLILFVPDVFAQFPLLRLIWPAAALVFAAGLAGYAWTEYAATQRKAAGGNP